MRSKFIVVGVVLVILVMMSSIGSAYTIDRVLTQGLGLKSLLYADWQMDYYLPLNPEELDRGDYRFTANMGRMDVDDVIIFGDLNESFNNYFLALDTGITDNLSMRLSYDYTPFIDNSDYELNNKVYAAFFNYSMENDKTLFFGYNRLDTDYRDKNGTESSDGVENDVNYYFVGFQKRGSFLGKNE